MRDPVDLYTRDLIDKPARGRPRKANALTSAQRAQSYRDRQRLKRASIQFCDVAEFVSRFFVTHAA